MAKNKSTKFPQMNKFFKKKFFKKETNYQKISLNINQQVRATQRQIRRQRQTRRKNNTKK